MLTKKRTKSKKIIKRKSFLSLLYEILNDLSYNDIISWNIDGNGIFIKNVSKLCEIILPKFYKHNNYSSFVRQLNIYGFHKGQGLTRDGERFEHEIFGKKITREQIRQILIKNKEKRLISNNNMNYNYEDTKMKNCMDNNKEYKMKLLLDNILENSKNISALKTEILEANNQNKQLKENIEEIQNKFNGHSIFLEKFLKKKEKNKKNQNINNGKKTRNLKDLFKKYLYHLKIYSPYISILNNNNIYINKKEKEDFISMDIINYNNIKNILFNDNINTESFCENSSFIKMKHNIDSNDLILNNHNSSISF